MDVLNDESKKKRVRAVFAFVIICSSDDLLMCYAVFKTHRCRIDGTKNKNKKFQRIVVKIMAKNLIEAANSVSKKVVKGSNTYLVVDVIFSTNMSSIRILRPSVVKCVYFFETL